MKRAIAGLAAGVLVAVMGLWGPSPAQGIGDFENNTPKMVGGGWVGIGDPMKVHVQVHLPCGGAEVGFNPQPDPPGLGRARLDVGRGAHRFSLTRLDTSSCSLGGPDTIVGSGVGLCDGTLTAVTFRLTDGGGRAGIGNPDLRADSLQIDIRGDSSACTANVVGSLDGGNIHMVGDPTDG